MSKMLVNSTLTQGKRWWPECVWVLLLHLKLNQLKNKIIIAIIEIGYFIVVVTTSSFFLFRISLVVIFIVVRYSSLIYFPFKTIFEHSQKKLMLLDAAAGGGGWLPIYTERYSRGILWIVNYQEKPPTPPQKSFDQFILLITTTTNNFYPSLSTFSMHTLLILDERWRC